MSDELEGDFSRALFRYRVVSLIESKVQAGLAMAQAIEAVALIKWSTDERKNGFISKRSLYRWYKRHSLRKFKGLLDAPRQPRPSSLPATLLDFLTREKAQDPQCSIPELLKRAEQHRLTQGKVDRSTVYRACKKLQLPLKRAKKVRDSRRFEYPNRMLMVLCDGKHFRAGVSNRKRVCFIFFDDCSRYALHAVCGPSESKVLFLRGLYEVLRRYGRMKNVYVDNGSGFIAKDVEKVFCQLGIGLIHGEKGYPQGRGKLERFNRTIGQNLLRKFPNNASIDPSSRALELRINHYLHEDYNKSEHGSLHETPFSRFTRDPYPLDFYQTELELGAKFILQRPRVVTADHIVSLNSTHYETPLGTAFKKLIIYENLINGNVFMTHQGKQIQLHPVDTHLNAVSPRARPAKEEPIPAVHTKSAATQRFQQDYAAIVDHEGNFNPKKCEV